MATKTRKQNNTYQSVAEPKDFPKSIQKENIKKVIKAIDNLKLADIKHSRNMVFDSNGRTGDVFGVILKNAGLKDRFRCFRVKSFELYERGYGPRWKEAVEALAYVFGPVGDEIYWNIIDIQIMSDTNVAKRKLLKALHKLMAQLQKL